MNSSNPLGAIEVRHESMVNTAADLHAILDKITFQNSFFSELKFRFKTEPHFNREGQEIGWLMRAEHWRPDTDTGAMGWGSGRNEIIMRGCYEGSVVKTAWVCMQMTVTHELMEGVCYEGIRIFNPHHTIPELQLPTLIRRAQTEQQNGGDMQQKKEHAGWNVHAHHNTNMAEQAANAPGNAEAMGFSQTNKTGTEAPTADSPGAVG